MFKKFFNGKASISAILIALVLTMFIGCFANAPQNMDESFSGKYWYYINRGYPTPFMGWTLRGVNVALPHINLPFIVSPGEEKLAKIIDLTKFAPLMLAIFLLAYFPNYVFAKTLDGNNKLFPIWIIGNAIIIIIGIFIYFFWFPRI